MNSSGQSMLELVISIAVAVLVISALTVTTLIGIRNSQYAQNQLQASKLAQEGIEKIKRLRDRDIPICQNAIAYNWTSGINTVWSPALPNNPNTPFYFALDNSDATSSQPCQLTNDSNLTDGEDNLQGKFARKTYIRHNAVDPQVKEFTATVSWSDYSGSHQSQLVTILGPSPN